MLNYQPNVQRPSRERVERAQVLLHRALGASKVLTASESCEAFGRDDSEASPVTPDVVVLAETTRDVQEALRIAEETEVPLTPRAAGTGRVGGAIPSASGIVLSMLGMNTVKHLDSKELTCVVEAGLVLGELHRAVEAEGLFYPPDANSLLACTIGGNVATNAGGPRAFKYGVTRNYVLGLEATLMGGESFFAGRRTSKGVTGYDVTSLLVGSEGTLAVVGDITLRLVPKPDSVMTLLVLFDDVVRSGHCVESIIGAGVIPRCIELLDRGTLQAMRDAGNPIDRGAGAMLLMDVDGPEQIVEQQAERIGNICDEHGALSVLVAQDASQRDRLWAARREMSPAVRRMAKRKLSEDVVVPRQSVGELLSRVDRVTHELGVRSVTYGHAGDGNLHVNYLWDDEDEVPAVEQAIERLFKDVIELGGTLSGEHGIGLMKAPYLHYEQSPRLIDLQKQIKRVFDPKSLLNPGKIFTDGPGHGPC